MAEDFGSYLKHQRELRGIPLDEIAQTTKISVRFLRALEANQFDELPGEVFIKGFIRSYGQAIGSNVDEILAAYLEATGKNQSGENGESAGKASPSKPEAPSSSSPMKAVLGFGIALIVIGAGVYWFSMREAVEPERQPPAQLAAPVKPESDSTPTEIEAEPVPSDSEEPAGAPVEEAVPPAEPAGTVPTQETAAPGKPESQTPGDSQPIKNTVTVPEKDATIKDLQDQSVSKPEEISAEETPGEQSLKLVIRVEENAWFNLTVDDQRDQDFILPAGGSKTIDAKSTIVMTIGNRRATQLTLNGQALELPESPDNVIRNLTVNAEQLN